MNPVVLGVSVVTANGISGTVANPLTAPAITLDASAAITAAIAESSATSRWEPVTNGDPDDPEIVFAGGDVVMAFVED